ncbi:hypothetical protein HMPREF3232_00551 [Fannyhessea vaginae]|nr:hypothetical protein HMPREF3232_00551 [Fannyhessea vaginae]
MYQTIKMEHGTRVVLQHNTALLSLNVLVFFIIVKRFLKGSKLIQQRMAALFALDPIKMHNA